MDDKASTTGAPAPEADATARACRLCGRPLQVESSMARGIGPVCYRKARRAHDADPSTPFGPFNHASGDVALHRDKEGRRFHNLPGLQALASAPIDWGPHAANADLLRLASVVAIVLRLPGSERVDEALAALLRQVPHDGARVRGADLRACAFEATTTTGPRRRRGRR